MIIDNRATLDKVKKRRVIINVVFTVSALYVMISDFMKEPVPGIRNWMIASFIGLVYIVLGVISLLRKKNYIYVNIERNSIVFRYFSMSLFDKKKNAVEIPLSDFYGYELIKSYGNMVEELVLLRKMNKKVAKYPPISISILTKEERITLISTLDKIKVRR